MYLLFYFVAFIICKDSNFMIYIGIVGHKIICFLAGKGKRFNLRLCGLKFPWKWWCM